MITTVIPKLFRRGPNFYDATTENTIGSGADYVLTLTYANPGWVAFDFMSEVAPKDVESRSLNMQAKFQVYVDDLLRFETPAGWAWNRQYIWVREGENEFRFATSGYKVGDYAKIKNIVATSYQFIDYSEAIEQATMPKPLETVQSYKVLNGFQRYQATGIAGCELDFVIVFKGAKSWQKFMAELANFYIIASDIGVYGGTILTQDVDSIRSGDLILTKCKLVSDLRAGVGVPLPVLGGTTPS